MVGQRFGLVDPIVMAHRSAIHIDEAGALRCGLNCALYDSAAKF